MIVQCAACQSRFKIADEKVTERGVKVRCTKCSTTFLVRKPSDAAAVPPQAPAVTSSARAGGLASPDPFAPFKTSELKPAVDPFAAVSNAAPAARADPFGSFQAAAPKPAVDPFAAAQPSRPVAADPFAGLGALAAARRAEPQPAPRPAARAGGDPFGRPQSSAPAASPDPFASFQTSPPPAARPDPFAGLQAPPPAAADPFANLRAAARPAGNDPFASLPSNAPAPPAASPAADPFASAAAPLPKQRTPRGSGDPFAEPARQKTPSPGGSPTSFPAPASGPAPAPAASTDGSLGDDPFAGLPPPSQGFDQDLGDFDSSHGLAAPPAEQPAPAPAHDPFGDSTADLFGPRPTKKDPEPALEIERTSAPKAGALPTPEPEPERLPAPRTSSRPDALEASTLAQRPAQKWSRPQPPRRTRGMSTAASMLRAAICALLGVGLAAASFFVEIVPGEPTGAALLQVARGEGPAAQLSAEAETNGFYDTKVGRSVFLVRGQVHNQGDVPIERVRVTVELVKRSTVARQAETLAGAEPSPEEIYGVVSPEKLAALQQKLAPLAKPLAPGEAAPFTAVFYEYPDDLPTYSLRVTPRSEPVRSEPKKAAAPAPEQPKDLAPGASAEPAVQTADVAAMPPGVQPAVQPAAQPAVQPPAKAGKVGKAVVRTTGTHVRFKPPKGQ